MPESAWPRALELALLFAAAEGSLHSPFAMVFISRKDHHYLVYKEIQILISEYLSSLL